MKLCYWLQSWTKVSREMNIAMSSFNPLSPKCDQRQISPCNISALQNRVVMRIKDMITQDESN